MTETDRLIALAQVRGGPTDLIRLCLFDWVVCALAGKDEPVADRLAMLAASEGEASVVGGGQTTPAEAALINGVAGHALDYDDTHFDHIGHTSAVVMPAVLAVAEDQMLTLDEAVQAALIGSEAAVRVGLWLGRGHYQTGFHQTATAGAFGATLAAARLLQLDAGQTRHAVGLCATAASGLKGQFGTMGKPLNAGLAARTGVEAAQWARAGLTSDPLGLEQFGAAHHGAADPTAWQGDETWKITRISHKFHACCHGLHAMLEALAGVDPATVVAMTVHTHPRWIGVCDKPAPQTGLEMKFSYAMTAAMTLRGLSTGSIASYRDELVDDPGLIALRDRVTVMPDPLLSEMQCRVDVTDAAGQIRTLEHDLNLPLDLSTRQRRLQDKAVAILGGAAQPLWSACQGRDVSALAAIMRG